MKDSVHKSNTNHLLLLADKLINDDEPTIAMLTNPNDEVFHKPLNS